MNWSNNLLAGLWATVQAQRSCFWYHLLLLGTKPCRHPEPHETVNQSKYEVLYATFSEKDLCVNSLQMFNLILIVILQIFVLYIEGNFLFSYCYFTRELLTSQLSIYGVKKISQQVICDGCVCAVDFFVGLFALYGVMYRFHSSAILAHLLNLNYQMQSKGLQICYLETVFIFCHWSME